MKKQSVISGNYITGLFGIIILLGLYLTSLYNYLLFHGFAEIFSIIVAGGIFMIAWNSRKYIENAYLIFIAIAYLFIGGLDLLHTLSYKGMKIFTDYDYYANQLWIATRYLESLTLLVAFLFFSVKKPLKPQTIFLVYTVISFLLVGSIFYWKIFPICFVEGKGLTTFKKVSEYIISFILVIDMWLLSKYREKFEDHVYKLLAWSIIFTIISELAFTFYISNYGFSNLVGHYFKIFSFYFIYKAIIETGITKPYDIIFRELVMKEKSLAEAKKAADTANKAKSEFLANMSHELRTPLNAILGYTQLFKRDETLTQKQLDAIGIIHHSGEHLLLMINDILDLSKIEARRMELEPHSFHLHQCLQSLADMTRVRVDQKGIAFRYEVTSELPDDVYGDETRLRQILLNLLGNAVKFTEEGEVVFRVEKHPPTPLEGELHPLKSPLEGGRGVLRFQIEDTGIGISPERFDEIFEPFHQVADRRIQAEGTGLGLAISRNLVRMMGSELHVKSTEGQGSTSWFEVDFPVIEEIIEDEVKSYCNIIGFKSSSKQTHSRILVVDDYETNRLVLKELLTSIGFEIIEAINGHEAFSKAQEAHPDLILLDLVMPEMNGVEVVRQLRKIPALRNVPVIAVSASVHEETRQESLAAGCNDFIIKPFHADSLFECLQTYLDLEWIYRESSAPEAGVTQEAETFPMVFPSEEELKLLLQLVKIRSITGIQEYTVRLKELDRAFVPFASKIDELADHFAFEKIREFIEL